MPPARGALVGLACAALLTTALTAWWNSPRREQWRLGAFEDTCAARGLYEATDFAFAWCAAHGVAAVLVDGALIGAARSGSLVPWDHDVDMMLLTRNATAWEQLVVALRARFGPHVGSYVEPMYLDGGSTTESCGVNAQLAQHPLEVLRGVILHPFGGFSGWCRSRHHRRLPLSVSSPVRDVTLRHASRGWSASVRVPTNAAELVPPGALGACMPDHIGVVCEGRYEGGHLPRLRRGERWGVWLSIIVHGREQACPRHARRVH